MKKKKKKKKQRNKRKDNPVKNTRAVKSAGFFIDMVPGLNK